MTGVAAALAYPGSRSLAGWWRQLGHHEPRSLWLAHLLLHRVESPVRVKRLQRPDGLTLLVLQGLAVEPGQTLERLDTRLHLGHSLTSRILGSLEAKGLVARVTASSPSPPAAGGNGQGEGGWVLTAAGREAIRLGEYSQLVSERQAFYFADNGPGFPAHFVDLKPGLAASCEMPAGVAFDIAHLKRCFERPADWKVQHAFPSDVDGQSDGTPWQRVTLVYSEVITLLFVLACARAEERLLGFHVQQKGWTIPQLEPALTLGPCWSDALPCLTREPSADQWRQAWIAWAQSTGLPAAQAGACSLERREHHLRAVVPPSLFARLQSSRHEALKGEVWLLAGDERIRQAAQLQIAAAP